MVQYSIVVPIYNDGALADSFFEELDRVFHQYLSCSDISGEVELIFVNDGSMDDSGRILREVCDRWACAKACHLSRNFGQHVAVSCGYQHAAGQYVVMINVDMEDPPSEIPRMIEAMKSEDYDVTYGVYQHKHKPLFERVTSFLFHHALNRLTGYKIPPNCSTLRVMSRRFIDAYNSLSEKSRYLPGLEMWLGFRHGFVPGQHHERTAGKSSYNFSRRLKMAIDSVISFSDVPLRLVAAFGFVVAAIGFVLVLLLLAQRLFFVQFLPGWMSIFVVIIFFGGLQIFGIGMASLYVGRVLREVQNRPLYVMRDTYKMGRLDEARDEARNARRASGAQ